MTAPYKSINTSHAQRSTPHLEYSSPDKLVEPTVIQEEEAPIFAEFPEDDVPAMTCWRQFHTELLASAARDRL